MFEDNHACIKMIENPVISGRNKYVEFDCHFVRYHHKLGNITVEKIETDRQRADLMTKNLGPALFKKHVESILDTKTK